jgi:hypothetical protein
LARTSSWGRTQEGGDGFVGEDGDAMHGRSPSIAGRAVDGLV